MENSILKKQIEELSSEIEDLNNKLKKSEEFKGNFISNIMNEVYNPFSSIITLSDNILSLGNDNMVKAKEMAEYIYKEASKLDFHLQNIFMAATIEAGLEGLEFRKLDIDSLHKEAVNNLKIDIKSKNISVKKENHISDEIKIITDINKLKLILVNIISNSIKHCSESGEIICTYEHKDQNLLISIHDNGTGISDEYLTTIFNRFHRIDENINSVTGGAGLGLSVVKALIELLNGEISISNKAGTLVKITIPTNLEIDQSDLSDDVLFDDEIF